MREGVGLWACLPGERTRGVRAVGGVLLWVLAAMWVGVCLPAGAQVSTTAVSDVVYHADGTAARGTVLVSWPAFTTMSGASVPQGSTSVSIGSDGSVAVSLAPNAGATPMGTYYTAVYHLDDGETSREYWVVPVSSTPIKLSAVRASVLPTSVAMQTVSKQYVDQAIAKAALTGVVPQDASPYVMKTGDTMTGPLVLPGDPASALQAADKGYVDAGTTALQAGLAQKVSMIPAAGQTVTQPAGTQLQVNNLNGVLNAKSYATQGSNNGIANALSATDCASGCTVTADATYAGNEAFTQHASRTHLVDMRGGALEETALNPQSPVVTGSYAHDVTNNTTVTGPQKLASGTGSTLDSFALGLTENALTGGNNVFPENVTGTVPYFKSTYGAAFVTGNNYTQGQHVLAPHFQNCYGVGDCLVGAQFLTSAGGQRDNADEGTHPFDLQVTEDSRVFAGTCSTGCTTGSTQVQVAATSAAGTQGDGRFLIDKAAGKVISAGTLVGGSGAQHGVANFSGTSFPVSTFFTLAGSVLPQSNNMAPGTVTVAIKTSGVVSGYSTNTALAPAGSGVACVADAIGAGVQGATNYETANYTVVDGSHLSMTLNKPHLAGATIAMGGLCGYGLEQTVDTTNGIRQVFPVVGSISGTSLYYDGLVSSIVGLTGSTGGYANIRVVLTNLQRSGGVVTATVSNALPQDVNGLTLTVAGVADASFNGSFTVTTTANNQFTYQQAGANASSTGGTASVLTGGYALYPMAEVLSVFNTGTKAVDGAMTLAPNTVAWAAGDAVEEPHYFQERISADTTFVTQYTPRETLNQTAGVNYGGLTGAGLTGWTIANGTPASAYYGNGGTHTVPAAGMSVQGAWGTSLDMQAGDNFGILMRCNSHGCGRWDSSYNLFALQSNVNFDFLNYAPVTSTLTFNMRGTQYTLSPTSLTAGTINATTLNVTRVNGLAASASVDTTNAANITSGVLDAARLPSGFGGGGVCASDVAYSATPVFAVTCSNAVFHMPLNGNVASESFTGLTAGQRVTLVFAVGTAGATVTWSPMVHGGFVTSAVSGAPGFAQAGKYLVQEFVVDTDGVTLLNPGAINE